MSKLKVKQVFAETKLSTDKYGVNVKITPINETEVEIQFGHYKPVSQQASAADLRELASIFTEVAELLEGPSQTAETAETPVEEPGRKVEVVLEGILPDCNLKGVFSGLTSEQAIALKRTVDYFNAKLLPGRFIYTRD